MADVGLRAVEEDDLAIFYAHQRDPEAARMAAFPIRERDAFLAHWRDTVLGGEDVAARTIVVDGEVVGNVVSFPHGEERLIGYWVGREHWGRGYASRAVAEFVRSVDPGPLGARVAEHNVGSLRVLEKAGFTRVGRHRGEDGVVEVLLRLER